MDEAIAWHIGLDQADGETWHRFTAWLEADPAHADAYDRLTMENAALSTERLDALLPPPSPVAAVRAERRSWLRWSGYGGSAVAAAAAAWIALVPATMERSDSYVVETNPGMRHSLKLADGTRVEMNGGTRLQLDRNHPRVATLERGEAMFHVVHHADQPFEVRSGGVTLRDVGTAFNVARAAGELRVAVAEGSVLYRPEREAVLLTRGMALAARDGEDRLTLSHVEPGTVGGWRGGHLDFRDTRLATVAADLSRSTGSRIDVAPELAGRSFTGTLRLDRPGVEVARSLALLSAGDLRRDGPGWMIVPRSGGAR